MAIYEFLRTGSKIRMNSPLVSTLQEKQNEFLPTGSEVRMKTIISALQDKQNEWSLYRVASTGSKVRMNNTLISTLQYKQNEWSLYRFR